MDYHYNSDYFRDKKGLLNLIVQCVSTTAFRPQVVSEVLVLPHATIIRRARTNSQLILISARFR
jgi:hypothetical protein